MVSVKKLGRLILLDPGHGGFDPGAVGAEPLELHESEINLSIAEKLSDLLTASGFEVSTTRDSDVYMPVGSRLRIINMLRPFACISIHCNSSDNPNARGTEVIYRDDDEKVLAQAIQTELVKKLGTKDRGVRHDISYLKKKLMVLSNVPVPSCLVEVAFISNLNDSNILLDTSGIALAIKNGIEYWFTSLPS